MTADEATLDIDLLVVQEGACPRRAQLTQRQKNRLIGFFEDRGEDDIFPAAYMPELLYIRFTQCERLRKLRAGYNRFSAAAGGHGVGSCR